MSEFTEDAFFDGAITVRQQRYGYRFSIDSILLAGHVQPKYGDRVVDLGTGCGIIPLILGFRNPNIRIYGIEIQKELADLAAMNVSLNHMENQIEILCNDLKELNNGPVKLPVDLIVCNPPYRRTESGRINPSRQKAVARHEIKVTLKDIMTAARRILKVSGRLIMVYRSIRMTDLLFQMRSFDIEPKWIRMVHSFQGDSAKMILVKGIKGAGAEIEIAAPLYIYNRDGTYTKEAEKMLLGAKLKTESQKEK